MSPEEKRRYDAGLNADGTIRAGFHLDKLTGAIVNDVTGLPVNSVDAFVQAYKDVEPKKLGAFRPQIANTPTVRAALYDPIPESPLGYTTDKARTVRAALYDPTPPALSSPIPEGTLGYTPAIAIDKARISQLPTNAQTSPAISIGGIAAIGVLLAVLL